MDGAVVSDTFLICTNVNKTADCKYKLVNLLTCAVESYPTPGDIDDSSSPTPPTS